MSLGAVILIGAMHLITSRFNEKENPMADRKPTIYTQHLKNGTKRPILQGEFTKAMNDSNTEKITIESDKSYNHENCIHVRSGRGEYYAPKFDTKFEL